MDSSPDAMGEFRAPLLENFLVDRPGALVMRGGLQGPIATMGSTDIVAGLWTFNDKILLGRVAKSSTAIYEPWFTHIKKVAAAGDLALPQADMKHTDFQSSGVTTVTAGDLHQVIGGRGARLGSYVYGYGYGVNTATNAAVIENGGYKFRRRLLRWDGTATAPTTYVLAPEGAQDVRVHLNRLWVMGGRDVPSGAPGVIEQNALYYSINGGPVTDIAASWLDPVSGLVNKLVVDSDDSNDFGVALCKVDQNLVILKRRSIHVLYGNSPETFTLRSFSMDVGCVDPRSVVESDSGVYFMSGEGYMFFDGKQLINTTNDGLRSRINPAVAASVGDGSGYTGFARIVAKRLPSDYIMLSIVKYTPNTGAVLTTPKVCLMTHTPTNRWVTFSSGELPYEIPTYLARSSSFYFMFDGNFMIVMNELTSPESQVYSFRGYDYLTYTAFSVAIPARWYSRSMKLASPLESAQLHRFLIDYTMQMDGQADGQIPGWRVSLVDGNGNALVTPFQVLSQGYPTTAYLNRRRHTQDVFSEVTDIQVRVEWTQAIVGAGSGRVLPKAEIYDSVVEYIPGRQRRST